MPPLSMLWVLVGNLALLWALLIILWAISVRIKDASIIDIFWGPACASGAIATLLRIDGSSPRNMLIAILVCLWALRLALHLARRNLGHGEDFRYQRMREKQGSDAAFARWSLIWVFGLQGLIAWFVSLPVQIGQFGADQPIGAFGWFGATLFAAGLGFEAIGDAQLRHFKSDPANKGKLMMSGLWSWTRHPNYFGDATVWTGLTFVALEAPFGWITILSPIVMAHFLVNISGKAMLERSLIEKYVDYAEYRQKVSGFIPMPPKR